MNKKFFQEIFQLFRWLDRNKVVILLTNLFIWPYLFWRLFGIAASLLLLMLGWILGKWFFEWREIKTRPALLHPLIIKNRSRALEVFLYRKQRIALKRQWVPANLRHGFITILQVLYWVATQVLITLFLMSIVLYHYQSALVKEPMLRIIAIIAAITFLSIPLLGIDNPATMMTLKKWANHRFFSKIKYIAKAYMGLINGWNIYCFPFIVLGALTMTLLFFWKRIDVWLLRNFLLLYFLSIFFLLINHYFFFEKKGFLRWAGKIGITFKTILYLFIPGYLAFQLIKGGPAPSLQVAHIILAVLIVLGSLGLITKDFLYWHDGLSALHRSGKNLVFSYLKSLFRYGAIFLVLYFAYLGAAYFQNGFFRNQEAVLQEISGETPLVFRDLNEKDWYYPAMMHLAEREIFRPDNDHLIYPGRILDSHTIFDILFNYFDIATETYRSYPDIFFTYLPLNDPRYSIFKAAYYQGLIDEFFEVNRPVNRRFVLEAMAKVAGWPREENPINYALKLGIVTRIDSKTLNQTVSRSILAQMLYNWHLSQQNTFDVEIKN